MWLKSPRGWTGGQARSVRWCGQRALQDKGYSCFSMIRVLPGNHCPTFQACLPTGSACCAGEGRRPAGAGAGPTEQSFFRVWMQPERSFWTQQPEVRSMSRSLRTSCSICWSFRMQGENFAPRWMRSIWSGGRGCEPALHTQKGRGTSHPPTCPVWNSRIQGSLGLTELGPIQKFSCWMYFTLSYTPLFFSTCQGGSLWH